MGRDKALLPVVSDADRRPEPWDFTFAERTGGFTFGDRTAELLLGAADPVLEVGPGFTSLPSVRETPVQSGPLVAMASGGAELARRGWEGPVLVVATDLPRLNAGLLGWMSTFAPGRSVVPLSGGRPQPLCARYRPDDMDLAARLVAEGKRAMRDLIDAADPLLVPEDEWGPASGDPLCLTDVDTPDHLDAQLGE
jgi:molybdopterin-guanine dinucleotide biosynthesis protein A